MFQRYWDEFLTDTDPVRTATLLSLHAEYKIYLKQMAMARHMLLKALDLDENNVEAQELLKVCIFFTKKEFNFYFRRKICFTIALGR